MLSDNLPAVKMSSKEIDSLLIEIENSHESESSPCNTALEILLGKSVNSVFMAEDRMLLGIEDGFLEISVEGDCCSESWFADFFGFSKLLNAPIISIAKIELGDRYILNDNRTRQESDIVYGYALRTKHGTSVFSFRNSSNGWYGGWISSVNLINSVDGATKIAPVDGVDYWQAD